MISLRLCSEVTLLQTGTPSFERSVVESWALAVAPAYDLMRGI
ncbi:MAG: hypothetical protein QW578_06655 [Thermoplasmatales archaeon]